MFLVAGVSGNTGSIVADALLTRGKPVRVLVRDQKKGEAWRKRGAEVAVGTLEDGSALQRAFAGATGAYVLLPPRLQSTTPVEDNRKVARTIADAVRAAKVPHVVLLSSIGAQHERGTGPIKTLHDAERQLAGAGAASTAVRAAYFMENWAMALAAIGQGTLPTFLPPALRIPMVATRDIGLTAAAALVEGGKGRQVVELSGPREYSADDVAAALSALTGKQVRAQQTPLDGLVPMFTGMGVAAAVAELFREMNAGIAQGLVAWEGGSARASRGKVPIEDVLRPLLRR